MLSFRRPSNPTLRLVRGTLLIALSLLGLTLDFRASFGTHAATVRNTYWILFAALTVHTLLGGWLRGCAARWRLHTRVRQTLPGNSGELNGFAAAALAIKQAQEERALYILENLTIKSGSADVERARRWMATLASASWMSRQRPGRPLSSHHAFPHLQALVLNAVPARMPIRTASLERELVQTESRDLDALAQEYIALVDVLIASLTNHRMPFSNEAENLLEFTTGRVFIVNSTDRFAAWWRLTRPVLMRGGGALLVGMRLMQHEHFAQAAQLLRALGREGLLSAEAETLRRAATFLALFAEPQWHLRCDDVERYFADGCYHMAGEMGVLRFPMAEIPEVVACCRIGDDLRERKRTLIEDSLALWSQFVDDLSPVLAVLLKRLLEHKGRQCPARLSFWRDYWHTHQAQFDRVTALLMNGIAATAERRLADAELCFTQAAELDPQSSVARVNLVQVLIHAGERQRARTLARTIEKAFPNDGQALMSLGRFFMTHFEDSTEAERLILQARRLTDPPTEALICLGEIKFMEGLYIEAQEYFSDAKQLNPELPGPRLQLARVYMETRRFDLAIENLRSVARDSPPDARDLAHYLLYRTYREMGEDRKAFEQLDKVPARFFKEPDVLDDIAGHLESEHRYAKAREFAERAMILRANGGESSAASDDLLGTA